MTAVLRWLRSRSRLSLAQQLVLLAVLPAAIATTAVLVVTTLQYLRGLEALIQANAQTLAYQLATSAEVPMASLDRRALLRVARAGTAQPNTQSVSIWSEDGELLARADVADAAPVESLQVSALIVDAHGVGQGQVVVSVDPRSLRRAEDEGWRHVLLALGAFLLTVLLGGTWAARRISAPVLRLDKAMEQLGAGEAVQVPETGAREIRRLQQGFNRAARALASHRQEMQARIRDATAELERKNEQIERASHAKMRLLAAASHDLRQPLHALTLFADGLHKGETDPVRQQRIKHVQECVSSLDRLFAELLNLTQLDAGVVRPRWSRFALDRVFDHVDRTFRALAEENSLRLIVRPTPLWVYSDFTMLSRVLANLVSNSVQHTVTGGVLIAARARGNAVQIDVIDTGVGIAPEHQQRIFEEFYRIDDHLPRSHGQPRGLGLGLANVQRLGQLLKMPIELRSDVGRGTCVRLRVPLVAPARRSAARVPRGSTDALDGLKVLAIDDEPVVLQGLVQVLAECGCTVLAARSHDEARQQLDTLSARVDVVICDLLLSGDDGLRVLQALAEHPRGTGPRTACLLVTGETHPDKLRRARQSGLTVLCKPVTAAELRAAIVRELARQRHRTDDEGASRDGGSAGTEP